jgi:hypothetical protein
VLDLHRIGDYTPYVYRTHDFGKTWTPIVTGLATNQPSGSFARVVRNDTQKKGLLFAGTESGMYVSFDDGDHWQTLQQNLPTTSYRDLAIKDNDLVVATYGRGFWVLDDYSMLRQLTPAATIASEPAHLFKPGDAMRTRRNVGADTPFPIDVPHALNPRDGVALDYWLAESPSNDFTIDVLDASGAPVRHLSSRASPPPAEASHPPEPNYWLAPPPALPGSTGENRSYWDLRYDSPPAFSHSFEINANPGLTPASPEGPVVLPGMYTIELTVNGHSYTQTATVKPDPRSPATPAALRAQHALQMRILEGIQASYTGHAVALAMRDTLSGMVSSLTQASLGDVASRFGSLAAQLDTVAGLDAGRRGGRGGGTTPRPNFTAINGALVAQLNAQDLGDMAPTPAAMAAFTATCKELTAVASVWQRLSTTELTTLNATLKQRGRSAVGLPAGSLKVPVCAGP